MEKSIRPFGLWPSPITPALIGNQTRLNDVQWDSEGHTLVWLEGRGDRGVLVAQEEGQAPRDLTYEGSVRAKVGYGGGDFTVAGGVVVYADSSGRLFQRPLGPGQPRAVTPGFGNSASPSISPDGCWVAYVHTVDRVESIGLAALDGKNWPSRLVSGADFYMQPTWHPSGKQLAWIEWDHPNMPWDGTRLMLARLDGEQPGVTQVKQIAGGQDLPIFQPLFSPDGRWLSYLAGEGEWDSLNLYDLNSGECRSLVQGGVLIEPAWIQGIRVSGWSPSSQSLYYLQSEQGMNSLWRVDLERKTPQKVLGSPYTWIRQVSVSPKDEYVACIASGPTIPERVITWSERTSTVIRRSSPESTDPEDLPDIMPIQWLGEDGSTVYGLYSAPKNAAYQGKGLPPVIVNVHGGPTDQAVVTYSGDRAFFTSRGYAFLSLNYRGSTGYGRSYMLALRENWGKLDVDDAASAANALISQGLADGNRLVIKGGSAGGYTVLNALIRYPHKFKAGLCLFGVSNLFTLASDTHKFEERYTDSMVGPLPEAAQKYHDWSPIFFADQIQDPLAVFQGSVDVVVPPDQSETIVEVLRARKVPHLYRLYEGEGHGFRRADTLEAYYQDVEKFLKQYVIFSV